MLFSIVLSHRVVAQNQELDSLVLSTTIDSLTTEVKAIPHFPRKATMYSAVLPGLGQIYNKQWWKVPFIYGGFAYLGYTINQKRQYNIDIRNAYLDLVDDDPLTNSYVKIDKYKDAESNISSSKTILYKEIRASAQDRDTYILFTAAFYLFNILDANVSAHFLDFDISEDLTFNLTPVYSPVAANYPIPGFTLVYNF